MRANGFQSHEGVPSGLLSLPVPGPILEPLEPRLLLDGVNPLVAAGPVIAEPGWILGQVVDFADPVSARINPIDGLLYVGKRTGDASDGIYRIEADGTAVRLCAADRPAGIVIDPDDGDLFFSEDYGDGSDTGARIYRLAFGATSRETWVSGLHSGDDDPIGMAIAPNGYTGSVISPGEALVVDRGSGGPDEIWRFSPDSAEGETALHTDNGTLINAVDIAIGPSMIYTVDTAEGADGIIYKVGSGGSLTTVATSQPISEPVGVAFDPLGGGLLIADDGAGAVVRVNPVTGAVSDVFTGFSTAMSSSGVQATATGRRIVVTDYGADKIYIFVGLVVDTLEDQDGGYEELSLREALELAAAHSGTDTITFDPALAGGTILLTLGELSINSNVEIQGLGSDQLIVDANDASRVFQVTTGSHATISGLTIANGLADTGAGAEERVGNNGGGIYADGHALTLADVVVRACEARGSGGGLYVHGGDAVLTDAVVENNKAGSGGPNNWGASGGGIYNAGDMTLSEVTVSGNQLTRPFGGNELNGGGIYNRGLLSGTNVVVSGNHVWHRAWDNREGEHAAGAEAGGGGIFNDQAGTVTLAYATITNNYAAAQGGYIVITGWAPPYATFAGKGLARGGGICNLGMLEVTDSSLEGNYVNGEGGHVSFAAPSGAPYVAGDGLGSGGGVYSSGTAVFLRTTFLGNRAEAVGGIVSTSPAEGGRAYAGEAFAEGGGGFGASGSLTLIDVTISQNTADAEVEQDRRPGAERTRVQGGGLCFESGFAWIANSTICENGVVPGDYYSPSGGGICSLAEADVTAINTIIAGNYRGPGSPSDVEGDSGSFGGSYSLIGDAATSGGLVDGVNGNIVGLDPKLGPLDYHGGPTKTYSLSGYSPAVDMGDPLFDPNSFTPPLTTDQRGFDRLVDGDYDGTARVDIGAFELENFLPLVVTTDIDEDDGFYGDDALSLREALDIAGRHAGQDAISFDPALAGKTISLSLGQLDIDSRVLIDGLGADQLTVDGADASRVFEVHAGVSASISDLTITGGRADIGGDENQVANRGGGIYSAGTLDLTDVVLTGNHAFNAGGAVYNLDGCGLAMDAVTITNNDANYGAGLFSRGTAVIVDCTIDGNTATRRGGGIRNSTGGVLSVSNTTISNNTAGDDGGGISSSGTTVVAVNATISGNHTNGRGGGLFLDGSKDTSATLTNLTITDNDANADGGGVYKASGPIELHNTIVAGNRRGGADDDVFGDFITIGEVSTYNLIGWGDGADFVDGTHGNQVGGLGSPKLGAGLGPLAKNGGATWTHCLLLGSPAIDRGSDDRADDAGLSTDQRGFERFVNVSGVGGPGVVDVGALEWGAPIIVSDAGDELDFEYAPGGLTLREALLIAGGLPGDDVIDFDTALWGGTILLALGRLEVNAPSQQVEIRGPGADLLTVDAQGASGVFFVSAGAEATIAGLTITGGSTQFGGGIKNEGDLVISQCAVTENVATVGFASGGSGGGIHNTGTLKIIDSTISGNTSLDLHGISSDDGGHGGGVYNEGTLTVMNSTISGNRAHQDGGGVYNLIGNLEMTNVTVAKNTADTDANGTGSGGGVVKEGGRIVLRNTIVADNYRQVSLFPNPQKVRDDVRGGFDGVWSYYNLIAVIDGSSGLDGNGTQYGTAAAPLDALLGPLADNGGPTMTHAISEYSPAVDHGHPLFDPYNFTPPLLADQRGLPRVTDGNFDDTARVDVGAFEFELDSFLPLVVTTLADEADGFYQPEALTLREALHIADLLAGANEINFDPDLPAGTISLALGQLDVNSDVDVFGPGSDRLIVDAHGSSRVFEVHSGVTAEIVGLTISGGRADIGGDENQVANRGGGVYNAGTLGLTGVVLTGNHALNAGGAVYNLAGCGLAMDAVTITNNDANYGAGLFNLGTAEIVDSTIDNNTANMRGGGIRNNTPGVLTISNTTISNNTAGSDGGGLVSSGTTVVMTNTTVSGNHSGNRGGGLFLDGDASTSVTLTNLTITDNDANTDGGGVYRASGPVSLHNTIVAGNRRGTSPDDVYGTFDAASTSNLIGWGDGGSLVNGVNGNQVGGLGGPAIDPLLGPLADNGGPTWTHLPLPYSRAIDRGDNGRASALTTDQRGQPRLVDGDGNGSVIVDVGAVEAATFISELPGDANEDGVVDGADYIIVRTHMGQATGAGAAYGDFDEDGTVDWDDLQILRANFGKTVPQPAPLPIGGGGGDQAVAKTPLTPAPGSTVNPAREQAVAPAPEQAVTTETLLSSVVPAGTSSAARDDPDEVMAAAALQDADPPRAFVPARPQDVSTQPISVATPRRVAVRWSQFDALLGRSRLPRVVLEPACTAHLWQDILVSSPDELPADIEMDLLDVLSPSKLLRLGVEGL